MTTRGIQFIIDNASAIEISRAKTVGQLIVRSGRIRTAERASTQPWQLIVTPPQYCRYEDVRDVIEGITVLDRNTYFWIDFTQNSGLRWVTDYRGEINSSQRSSLRILNSATTALGSQSFNINQITGNNGDNLGYTSTATFNYMVLTSLPNIGDPISTSTVATISAQSFSTTTSVTYNRAFSTSRSDFLIKTADYDGYVPQITTGLTVSNAYVGASSTVTTITRDYTTLNGISYTRIVMSAAAASNSAAATDDGDANISTNFQSTKLVSSSTYLFRAGDWIQFKSNYKNSTQEADRGLPRTIPLDVQRGSSSTVIVPVSRPFVWNSPYSNTNNFRANGEVYIGNDVRLGMVITKLPSYKLLPGKLVQWSGDFELYEFLPGANIVQG